VSLKDRDAKTGIRMILDGVGTFEGGGSDAAFVGGCIFVDDSASLFQAQFSLLSKETAVSLDTLEGYTDWLLRR
jgi:hypothetical protein